MVKANVVKSAALMMLIIMVKSSQATEIICHDCTGLDECSYLLKNAWTGKCHAQITGKCFIRKDPNGILYRGCADSLNWPRDLVMDYNGCRYQSYGEWSDTEVLWCFCDRGLCNTNISYIQNTFPGASSSQVRQGQSVNGQARVSAGVGYWHRIDNSGSGYSAGGGLVNDNRIQSQTSAPGIVQGRFQGQGQVQGQGYSAQSQGYGAGVYDVGQEPDAATQRPDVVDPIVYLVSGQSSGFDTKEFLASPPIIVERKPAAGTYDSDADWRAVQQYLQEAKLSAARGHLLYPPLVEVASSPPPTDLDSLKSTPDPSPKPEIPYYSIGGGGGGGAIGSTTTPSLNVPVTSPTAGSGQPMATVKPPATVKELFAILNKILLENGLTALAPATNATQQLGAQLIYDIPADLLKYLQVNLPRGVNSVQSLPYQLYVILYLLTVAGYNINNIVPGLNIPYTGLAPTPPFDIPVIRPNQTGNVLSSICPSDFIIQPSLGSCYKVFSQTADAKPVAQARESCKQKSNLATLVSINTIEEKNFIAGLLRREQVMLDGWQGWWTSGSFRSGVNQFYWEDGVNIPNSQDFWGFQRTPFTDTCVWVLQIPNYNYTLGNYDCLTASGFICEIDASKATTP